MRYLLAGLLLFSGAALSDGLSYPPSSTTGAPPTGAAGGGLAGTYPNPTVASVPCTAMPALTGDTISTAGGCATTNVGLNGTLLNGLGTGLLKNTTGTGVPSIAVANTDYLPVASPTATGTLTVPVISITGNGAASTPAATLGGTWFSGGSSSTTTPQFYVNCNGSTQPAWSTSGTGIAANSCTGFVGNLIELAVNGANEFSVSSAGAVSTKTITANGGASTLSGGTLNFNVSAGSSTSNLGTGTTSGLVSIGGASNATTIASPTVNLSGITASSLAQTGTVCIGAGGALTYDTTTTCLLSALKFKQDVQPLDVGLSELMKLRPVSYSLKPQYDPDHLGRQIGMIADEVQDVDPRLVGLDGEGKVHGVRYEQMVALLAKAIQEQQQQISELRVKVSKMQHSRQQKAAIRIRN